MPQNRQELPNDEEQTERWRPQGWSANGAGRESRAESPQKPPGAQLRLDNTITICVTEGRSVRLAYQLTKPRASIGNFGGGADDERIDEADLENLSTFRIGSTEFALSIVPNRNLDIV